MITIVRVQFFWRLFDLDHEVLNSINLKRSTIGSDSVLQVITNSKPIRFRLVLEEIPPFPRHQSEHLHVLMIQSKLLLGAVLHLELVVDAQSSTDLVLVMLSPNHEIVSSSLLVYLYPLFLLPATLTYSTLLVVLLFIPRQDLILVVLAHYFEWNQFLRLQHSLQSDSLLFEIRVEFMCISQPFIKVNL